MITIGDALAVDKNEDGTLDIIEVGRAEEADRKAADQAALGSKAQLDDIRARLDAATPAPAVAPAAAPDDVISQLEQLAGMKTASLFTGEEYATDKATLPS